MATSALTDPQLLSLLSELSNARSISAVLRAALVYDQVLHGQPVSEVSTSTASSPKGGRGRSRSRGKRRGSKAAPPTPTTPVGAEVKPAAKPLVSSGAPPAKTPAPAKPAEAKVPEVSGTGALPKRDTPENRQERRTLVGRLQEERRTLREAMGKLYESNDLATVTVSLAKAANVRSRLANNYAERTRRGWDTPDARTLDQDMDELGNPGEPEFWAVALGWPVYPRFVAKDGTLNHMALVLQVSGDEGSLWTHPEKVPRAQVSALRRLVPGDGHPPQMPGVLDDHSYPSDRVWQRLSEIVGSLDMSTEIGDESSRWSAGTVNTVVPVYPDGSAVRA